MASHISSSSTKIVPEKKKKALFFDYRQATHKLNSLYGWSGATYRVPLPHPTRSVFTSLQLHSGFYSPLRAIVDRKNAHSLRFHCMNTNKRSNTNSEKSKYQNSALSKSSSANQIWGPVRLLPPSIGRFRVRCGGGVRIRQSDSDFKERGNNLSGGRKWAQHRN